MNLTRKDFIKLGLISTTGVFLSHFILRNKSYTYRGWTTPLNSKVGELLQGIPYQVDAAVARSFILDYMNYTKQNTSFSVTDKLKQRFLLSTNFLNVILKKESKIKYIRYYDPYIHPCYNPYIEIHRKS